MRPTNDPEYRAFKHYLEANWVQCWYVHDHKRCTHRATSPDHRPRLSEHTHIRGTRCCELLPACAHCNTSDGARAGNRQRNPTSEDW